MRIRFRFAVCLLVLVFPWLAGCAAGGNPKQPIPTRLVAAPEAPATRLVVMLPGRGDDLQGLGESGIAQIIQRQWPDADVLLTGLTMPYYTAGNATRRLHDEVIVPARKRHYRQIWLAGISLGGFGALLYDHAYPDQVDGMLLMSPYLGETDVQDEIRTAGGVVAWQPGPPQPMGPSTFSRELWRGIRQWSDRPRRTGSIWLAYGEDERFRDAIELMSPQLPPDHVVMLPGHHDWTLWKQAAPALLQRASKDTGARRGAD